MHCWDSNMRKKNNRGVVVAEGDVEAAVVVEELTIMGALRLRTAKVLTLTSTSLKSTTWFMRSLKNLYHRSTLIIMKIPEEVEVVVVVEVAVGVVVVTIMMRLLIHVRKQHPSANKKRAKMIFRHLEVKLQLKGS